MQNAMHMLIPDKWNEKAKSKLFRTIVVSILKADPIRIIPVMMECHLNE